MQKLMKLSPWLCLCLAACTSTSHNKAAVSEHALPPGNPLSINMDVVTTDTNVLPAHSTTDDGFSAPTPYVPPARKVQEDIYTSGYQEYPEVVRYDRYTLVSSSPAGGQKYLLEQLVTVDMLGKSKRPAYTLSVEQGLRNTLKDTGFTLCYISSPEVKSLFNLQLPKVHYKFGPMRLREALQMLSGEAYELTVNDTLRQVCFEHRKNPPPMIAPSPKVEAVVERTR